MNAQERLRLLHDLERLAAGEAENVGSPMERLFLPLPAHALALRPEIVVVRGGRGAGKSALFKLIGTLDGTDRLRRFFQDDRLPDASWVEAFAQSARHPDVAVLDTFAAEADADALRAFWMAHLLLRIAEQMPELATPPAPLREAWEMYRTDPKVWVPVAQAHLGAVAQALDRAELALEQKKTTVFAAYDHLDRIGAFAPDVRRRYVGALLALWLSFANRYRAIRAKIFLREDLFDAGELGFPDASKLRARSVSIEWDVASLYRVVVRHMAEASDELRRWLARVRHGLVLEDRGEFGWMPGPMNEDTQKAFATQIAGEVMGAGARKGYTHRWIPNHLQDAQRRIVPRSMLNLFGFAGREAIKHPLTKGSRLVTPTDLGEALVATSRARVGEIKEEYELVLRLDSLRGAMVPLDRDEVLRRVAQPVVREPAGIPTDGKMVFEELFRLGVLSLRPDGRIDVPDIYRSGFGILRKGGTARAR
ncbi:uncharacterized protein SOCEGT47_082620 [Sorangium cellulosum]|uniref:Uncharacterized protein n=1 Tax=Sorangium cellulosum TaxID=56 RepID=A0A4P2QD14_SORCE|nr:hypothetical protein [Sorangium cellulosum]AUX27664.1 uncharacterized protein SOCEGT47_082620 [Sorangium cellulosum]